MPSSQNEFKLPITAGQFSVDAVRGPVTEFLVLPGTNVVRLPLADLAFCTTCLLTTTKTLSHQDLWTPADLQR